MKKRNAEVPGWKQNDYLFEIVEGRSLRISSNFESGNIRLVRQNNHLSYVLEAVGDAGTGQAKKAWFYFKMQCAPGYRVRLSIQNVNILEYCQDNRADYQPLCKVGTQGQWHSLANAFLSNTDQLTLLFDYRFNSQEQVFFCISLPFTYTDNQLFLQDFQAKIRPNINYKNELLALTPEKREVRLISITEHGKDTAELERSNKPVILITCRVHPGEVSSSYTLLGMLDMLIENTLQSYLLRRLFEWKIVPMVNPDGVVAGNYRLDPLGVNLNRYYSDPNEKQHPAIFAIMQLMAAISSSSRRIEFYFDMHSHSNIKEAFIYGNALEDIIKQSYSQLFCRVLEENSLWFRSNYCQFGQRHMKHKDKGEDKSKEGCGRVMAYKVGRVARSYTLESSMIPHFYEKAQKNTLKRHTNEDFRYSPEGYSQSIGLQVKAGPGDTHSFIEVNRQFGRSVLVSILDMLQKNPYSRMSTTFNETYLKQLAPRLLITEERFKIHDCQIYSKARMVYRLVQEQIECSIEDAWNRTSLPCELNAVNWPKEFRPLKMAELNARHKFTQTGRLHSQMAEPTVNRKIRARPRLRTENLICSNDLTNKLTINEQPNPFLDKGAKERKSLQAHYSLELSDRAIQIKDIQDIHIQDIPIKDIHIQAIDIFEQGEPVSIDRVISPSVKFNHDYRKNTPRKYVVQNLCPSISLLQTNQFIPKDKERHNKLKVTNFYKAFVENRKKTESYFKNMKQIHNLTNSRAKSNLGESSTEKEKTKSPISRIDMSMVYREGFQRTIKLTQKVEVSLPWMKRNQSKSRKEKSFQVK